MGHADTTNGITERLYVANFLSIEEIDWTISSFNIITGGTAAGKSICIKLLYFFEQILEENIFIPDISQDMLNKEAFYNHISERFHSIFHSKNREKDFCNTKIEYIYAVIKNKMVFDLTVVWNKKNKKLDWKSKYLNTHIEKWRAFFDSSDISSIEKVKMKIYKDIINDFSLKFPIMPLFVPASRAVASVIDGKTLNKMHITDPFLFNFIFDVIFYNNNFIDKEFPDKFSKLMHLKEMKADSNGKPSFISNAGNEITQLEFSSGQQGLYNLLLFISSLDHPAVFRGEEKKILVVNDNKSVFIEEPSAHLFPEEQKDIIVYFAEVFRKLNDIDKINVKFIITTHSPYALDIINNMLKKGRMLERYKDHSKEIEEVVAFPHLFKNEVSAMFIENGIGKSMFIGNDYILSAEKISRISFSINNDANKLANLNTQFMSIKGN